MSEIDERVMKMSNKVELVVFDWAGTTIDYGCMAPLAVFEKILENKKIHLSREEILKPMGKGKKDHIKTLLQTESATKQWLDIYERNWTEDDIDEMFAQFNNTLLMVLSEYCEPIDDVLEAIRELKKMGLHIGTTTGYTREMMDIVEPGARAKGYEPEYVVTSEMTDGYGRPYPYMVFENMRHFSVKSTKNVVKVGDTVTDIKEGKNAGVWSIGVVEGSSAAGLSPEMAKGLSEIEREVYFMEAEKKMKEAGADFVIRRMEELPTVINKINKLMEAE